MKTKKEAEIKKSNFLDTQQVMTAKCSLLFFWVNSKFKVYIGKHALRKGQKLPISPILPYKKVKQV